MGGVFNGYWGSVKLAIKDDPMYASVMRGVREGFYTLEEIKDWIKHGKIRSFQR